VFQSGKTRPEAFRQQQIYAIYRCIDENQEALLDALVADGKNRDEAYISDLLTVVKEIAYVQSYLRSWMEPERVSLDMAMTLCMDSGEIIREPLGCVLIIGTWNYPVSTVLGPLIAAISAGNTAVIKLSEVATHTAEALAKFLPMYLDKEAYPVVSGAVPEVTGVLFTFHGSLSLHDM
jgi:aldehyde dehydrogenase (NAD+)